MKMRPNQKVEENILASELIFSLKYKWAIHNFGGLEGNINEPYWGQDMIMSRKGQLRNQHWQEKWKEGEREGGRNRRAK